MPKITAASDRQTRAHERETRRLRTALADAQRECELLRAAAARTEVFITELVDALAYSAEQLEEAGNENEAEKRRLQDELDHLRAHADMQDNREDRLYELEEELRRMQAVRAPDTPTEYDRTATPSPLPFGV
jgi:hypothetical protein